MPFAVLWQLELLHADNAGMLPRSSGSNLRRVNSITFDVRSTMDQHTFAFLLRGSFQCNTIASSWVGLNDLERVLLCHD